MQAATGTTGQSGKWMALTAALLGWMFDGFEMGLFPLIGQPALQDLLDLPAGDPNISRWFGVIIAVFLLGAATGGVFFGWLGDRIGRVRAMALSILTYAIFTGLCGFATAAWQIAVLRFIASLGMGGEWALGVALVTELWPDRSRAFLAGLIGAAANVGFLLVGLISLVMNELLTELRSGLTSIGLSVEIVNHLLDNSGWRFLMIIGALPALLVFFIRLFVPESERWQHEKDRGATTHWANRDLGGVLAGAAGAALIIFLWSPKGEFPSLGAAGTVVRAVGTLLGLVIAIVGYMYPVMRYLGRAQIAGSMLPGSLPLVRKRMLLGAALAGVALIGTWGSIQWAPRWAIQLGGEAFPQAKEYTQISLALGAIVGTILAALMGGWLGRRITYTVLCVGSTLACLALYQFNDAYSSSFLLWVFLAGGVTASFYGWFPLYMPEIFPTAVRATAQGFAYNFGRVIAAIGTLQTATLMTFFDNSFPKAGSALSVIYLIGAVIIWFGPETKGKPLPD
jgi:MFS transporter, SHS family, sialic acid transporter